MKVFLLIIRVPYECSDVEGVYARESMANEAAKSRTLQEAALREDWRPMFTGAGFYVQRGGGVSVCARTYYDVEVYEVQP